MKALFGIGLLLIVLGLLSLVVPVPRTDRDGVKVGGVSINVSTHHDEKLSPIVSGALILGGIAMVVAGKASAKA